jgi:DNA repair protein RadB
MTSQQHETAAHVSTGIMSLDRMLGGLPRGELTLLYGEPATGKTTFALQIASKAATNGLKTLFIDADNSFYPERLASMIGDGDDSSSWVSRLIFVSKPTTFSVLTRILENLGSYASANMSLIVVDTVTSLYRRAMARQGENVFSLNRELNLQLAYLTETAKTIGPAVLVTSQVRSIPQGCGPLPRIEPVATRLVKFWSHTILRLSSSSGKGLRALRVEKADSPRQMGDSLSLRLEAQGLRDL